MNLYDVIKKPVITEKSMVALDACWTLHWFHFKN